MPAPPAMRCLGSPRTLRSRCEVKHTEQTPIPPLFERMDRIRRLARPLIRDAAAELLPFGADGELYRLPIRLADTRRNPLQS